jgi:hypothetical protein
MPIKKNTLIRLKSFLGTLKPTGEISEKENYWKLIGEKGEIIDDTENEKVLILFDKNLDELNLENHNPIRNSLWIRKADLEIEEKTLPADSQIHYVTNSTDFKSTPFHGDINAICWKRQLNGDFSEIVQQFDPTENILIIDSDDLLELKLTEQGKLAREILLEDISLLKEHGASPTLNLIRYYERDDSFPFFPTDVYSFHVDRSPVPTDTILCTYYGASSDILPNAQAEQKIHVHEIREELKKIYDGPEDGFDAFLKEYHFDLHYQPKPGAPPINLGQGHIWRLAVDHPGSQVLPCIHRAPVEKEGELRLLLIC